MRTYDQLVNMREIISEAETTDPTSKLFSEQYLKVLDRIIGNSDDLLQKERVDRSEKELLADVKRSLQANGTSRDPAMKTEFKSILKARERIFEWIRADTDRTEKLRDRILSSLEN